MVLYSLASVGPAGAGHQVVVRDRAARPGSPARLVVPRVRGEDQDVAGIRGGKTAAGYGFMRV